MRRPDHQTQADVTAGAVLAPYLRAQAADFLRSLRLHRENSAPTDAGPQAAEQAAWALRRSARRISGTLHTFRAALDPLWAEQLRTELAWLSGTLGREHAYADRLNRLLDALHGLSGAPLPAARTASGTASASASASASADKGRAVLGVGAARAGALLERQLTLARTRAHSAALQALGSSRFHAVADAVALLASEVPLSAAAADPSGDLLHDPAGRAEQRLLGAVAALPVRDGRAVQRGARRALAPDPAAAAPAPVRPRGGTRRPRSGPGRPRPRPRPAPGRGGGGGSGGSGRPHPRIAPTTAYALGVLHADQRHEVEAARSVFRECWPYATAAATRP